MHRRTIKLDGNAAAIQSQARINECCHQPRLQRCIAQHGPFAVVAVHSPQLPSIAHCDIEPVQLLAPLGKKAQQQAVLFQLTGYPVHGG